MRQSHVVCPGCTCLCDDIEILSDDACLSARNACRKGQTFFEEHAWTEPVHFVENQTSNLPEALDAAAKILNDCRAPLICGLDQLTTQAQQIAWKIAEQISATIDTSLTNKGRGSLFALQRVGKVSASLGEVASRSDLVVFWFCDPETTHPRLLERLTRSSRDNREILVIGDNESMTARSWGQPVPVDRDRAVAVLAVFRAILKGIPLDSQIVLDSTGLAVKTLQEIVRKLQSAKYGTIVFDQIAPDSVFDVGTESLSRLIRELNNQTRFVALKLRADANAMSAENVLSWSSGNPMAINYAQGLPRFNWLEYSAETVLQRKECDAVLFATGADLQETLAGLSTTSREFMGSIPSIALSPISGFPSSVSIQVAVPGLDADGEFCRFDDVSLPLTNVSPANHSALSAESILSELSARISARQPK